MMPEVMAGSKRANTFDEYSSNMYKVSKSDNLRLRLLLVGRYCGALIGKGGENIRKIREEHSVRIHGLNSHTNERVLSVEGARENCVNCVKDVLSYCAEGPYPAITQKKCTIEVNLLLNSDTVGSIIGKGGSKIKEITDATDAKIKVYPESLPNSNERVVAVGADDEERVIAALNHIINILGDFPSRINTIYYDPSSISSSGVDGTNLLGAGNQMRMGGGNQMRMGGGNNRMGMGGGNQMGMGGGNRMGMGAGNKMGMGGGYQMGASGGYQNYQMGMGGGYQNYQMGMGGGNQMGMNAGLQGQGGMGYGNYNNVDVAAVLIQNRDNYPRNGTDEAPDFSQVQTMTELTVPNEMCSSIIGKSGLNIRMIRTQSGAKIQTTQTEKGSTEDRVITITGTQEQVQIAEQLMQQCARSMR